MTSLSTHVLDAALGRPAAGIEVTVGGPDGTVLEQGTTDDDGRLRLTTTVDPGPHTLTFATGPWFAAAGRATLFPQVAVVVGIEEDEQHYHVALLLSPFSYTTYRGS